MQQADVTSHAMAVFDALPSAWRCLCRDYELGPHEVTVMVSEGVSVEVARAQLEARRACLQHNRLHKPARLDLKPEELNLLRTIAGNALRMKRRSIDEHWSHTLRHHRLIARDGITWSITMKGRTQLALHDH